MLFADLALKVSLLRQQNPTNKDALLRDLLLQLWTDEDDNYKPFQVDKNGRILVLVIDARINDKNEIELFERIPE